jgi:hypothetical protein
MKIATSRKVSMSNCTSNQDFSNSGMTLTVHKNGMKRKIENSDETEKLNFACKNFIHFQDLFVSASKDSTYSVENAFYMCVSKNMHGTAEIPMSGQCYEEKAASKKLGDVQYTSRWCYCRNGKLLTFPNLFTFFRRLLQQLKWSCTAARTGNYCSSFVFHLLKMHLDYVWLFI